MMAEEYDFDALRERLQLAALTKPADPTPAPPPLELGFASPAFRPQLEYEGQGRFRCANCRVLMIGRAPHTCDPKTPRMCIVHNRPYSQCLQSTGVHVANAGA